MHRAHQELFKRAEAIVVIEKGNAQLTPGKVRCEFTKLPCYFFHLKDIKQLDARGFLHLLQEKFPNLQKIVIGYDFAFGKDRKYSIKDLQELFDGEVEVVPEIKIDGISVHSRVIKEFIKEGKIEEANKLLGRPYMIEGKVVKGQGIGKEKLVPTINLQVHNFLLPKEGVYATKTQIDGKIYKSVTFIGHRITTDGSFAVETHILESFEGEPKSARIYFYAFLRPNKAFDSLDALKRQIMQDIQKAKVVLEQV
ncbi:riboflavin kinase / FMN adenylyltransferase [Nitratiruptor sp. YY09-18]|nr:riboflavin kinase / FMN adenylyltransferase [Nitratiruptor sp. YY09-18]